MTTPVNANGVWDPANSKLPPRRATRKKLDDARVGIIRKLTRQVLLTVELLVAGGAIGAVCGLIAAVVFRANKGRDQVLETRYPTLCS